MSRVSGSQRTAFVHIGTHKTGTTSLQELLARNDRTLRRSGLLVPKACRIDRHSGHHNLAWELSGDPRFESRFGTFHSLLAEVRTSHAPSVCLSSEDLELLHDDPHALALLRDGLLDAGYAPKIVVYLRPQADYIESAYAEIIKLRRVDFEHFLESILTDGRFGKLLFAYDVLAERFADVFGRQNMIVRAYESHRPSAYLLNTFLMTVAPGIASGTRLAFPGRLNPMARACFDPLTSTDIDRIGASFRRANERLCSIYGVAIAHTTAAMAMRGSSGATGQFTVQRAAGN
jgi:hypothetical protein